MWHCHISSRHVNSCLLWVGEIFLKIVNKTDKASIPATTPRTPSSNASFSTNCCGVRYRTCENSTLNSLGVRLPQNGAQEERTRFRSHFATTGALFNNIQREVINYLVLHSSQAKIDLMTHNMPNIKVETE